MSTPSKATNFVLRSGPPSREGPYICECCWQSVTRRELAWTIRDTDERVCPSCAQDLLWADAQCRQLEEIMGPRKSTEDHPADS